jgi:hypothetical protein
MNAIRTTSDVPAALNTSAALWLCGLIVIAVFVAPFFGTVAGWVAAIGLLIVLLPLCLRLTSYRLAAPDRPQS